MSKEFLKLENRLILTLEIEPISPLIIKMGDGEAGSKNIVSFVKTEATRVSQKSQEGKGEGEIYIPGSTLRGIFRERFNRIYDYKKNLLNPKTKREINREKKVHKEVEKLFGWVEQDKSQKGRIFVEDAYLSNQELRKQFYSKKTIIKTRSITPIDTFSGKAIVPLKVEYTYENFITTIIVNNISIEELQNVYYVIRDSHLGEVRIGNSKTRGFGQIKLNIKKLVLENYLNKSELIKYIERKKKKDELFKKNSDSIIINDKVLKESLELQNFEVDIEKPSEFINLLFEGGE